MPSSAQWVAVCVPTGTGDPYAFVGPTSPLRCTMPSGAPGSTHLKLAYLSDSPSLFEMTAEDGVVASGLIVSCWVAAFAVRSVIAVFKGSTKDD